MFLKNDLKALQIIYIFLLVAFLYDLCPRFSQKLQVLELLYFLCFLFQIRVTVFYFYFIIYVIPVLETGRRKLLLRFQSLLLDISELY